MNTEPDNDPVSVPPPEVEPLSSQKEALQEAAAAAKNGKPVEMIEALFKSYLLDGLTLRFLRNWSSFTHQDAEDVVAEAVGVLYQTVANGKPVGGITSFLKKVAHRKAFDLHAKKSRTKTLPPGSSELDTIDLNPANLDEPPPDAEEPEFEDKLRLGIAKARELLPRLGQDTIRQVMSYIFDAVEAGQQNISNEEIEEALGLSSTTVRQAKSRGFRRLKRLAQDERLLPKDFDFYAIAASDDAGDDEEEGPENQPVTGQTK